MLKVVGASWLQTRISTYILVTVALLGVGAIIFGEYGRVENDGTYSATVWWKHRSGYRIDFWGQGNDLTSLPAGAARGYYKTGIYETGWSIIEIETSSEYPDDVQAYAAGLLEGSLTWQLIHHHWHNTVRAACAPRAALCRKMRRYLRENAANARENAALLRFEDPYWHMVHLYYAQLDGLAEGWRFAVQRRGQDVEIQPEDFLWLAMASDLPDLERASNGSSQQQRIPSSGMIVLKAIEREHSEPLIGLAHNSAAPYARMLRLLKRYKFAYRLSPDPRSADEVPGQSIAMSSYPGALSSQDESYVIGGARGERIVVGTPIVVDSREPRGRLQTKDRVMSAARLMAANRLAVDALGWSQLLERQNSGTSSRQWLNLEPRTGRLGLVEQIPGFTDYIDRSDDFRQHGYLGCTGAPFSSTVRQLLAGQAHQTHDSAARAERLALLQLNVTSVQALRNLMNGHVEGLHVKREASLPIDNETLEDSTPMPPSQRPSFAQAITAEDSSLEQLLAYRGDLDSIPRPLGVIDSKLFLFDRHGIQSFDARSGPPRRLDAPAFDWAATFPNASRLGQPQTFGFDSLAPQWVWL